MALKAFAVLALLVARLAAQAPSYSEAVERIEKGDFPRAIEVTNAILKQRPGDLKALTLKGMALSGAGQRDEANRLFKQILTVNSSYAPALRGLAMNEAVQGRTAEAQKHFEALLKFTPEDPIVLLGLGEIYLAGKQPSKASALLARIPEKADGMTHFQAGLLLARLEDYAAAARQFELARDGPVNDYDAGFNLALARFRAGYYQKAIHAGEALIAQGHPKAEVYNLVGRAYEKAGDVKKAYDSLRAATKIDPSDETSYVDLIAICLDHRNLDLAQEIAEIGVAKIPASGRLRLQEGIVLATMGKFPEAKSAFEKAIQTSSESSLPHVALGLVLLQMDQSGEAIEVLRRRAKHGTDDYLVLWFLGEALSRSGVEASSPEGKEAIYALERSVKLRPDVPAARVTLSKLLLRRGDLEAATRHLEAALKIEPENVAAIYQLAQVLSKKNDMQRAKELFAKVSKAKAEEREQFTTRGLQQIVREGSR